MVSNQARAPIRPSWALLTRGAAERAGRDRIERSCSSRVGAEQLVSLQQAALENRAEGRYAQVTDL